MRRIVLALALATGLLTVVVAPALAIGGGPPTPGTFPRGDANGDCSLDVSDPITVINFLFSSSPMVEVSCGDCTDANDDNDAPVDLSHPISVTNFLFQGGPPSEPAPHDPFLELSCDGS